MMVNNLFIIFQNLIKKLNSHIIIMIKKLNSHNIIIIMIKLNKRNEYGIYLILNLMR